MHCYFIGKNGHFSSAEKYQPDTFPFTSEVSFSLIHNNKTLFPLKRGRGSARINEIVLSDSPNSSLLTSDLSWSFDTHTPTKTSLPKK